MDKDITAIHEVEKTYTSNQWDASLFKYAYALTKKVGYKLMQLESILFTIQISIHT